MCTLKSIVSLIWRIDLFVDIFYIFMLSLHFDSFFEHLVRLQNVSMCSEAIVRITHIWYGDKDQIAAPEHDQSFIFYGQKS